MYRFYRASACASLLIVCAICAWAQVAQNKDYKDVPLAEIGVTPVKPLKDAKTGFTVGGKNSTELIRGLKSINGRTIAELEKDMRPDAPGEVGSYKGFLGKDEKLLDVLAMDNAFVVDKLGLTHQDLARPLHVVAAIGDKLDESEKGVMFRYHGQSYKVQVRRTKGYQLSPFYDDTKTSYDCIVENLTAKKKLAFSPLVPHMIERYGFYEGKGTPYRVDPAAVLEVFPFLQAKARS